MLLIATLDSRIIPTRMGTSYLRMPNIAEIQDHPHAYGDKYSVLRLMADVIGSSPRVWGQEHKSVKRLRYYRIIPTRMGTRNNCSATTVLKRDHPHAYGDKEHRSINCGGTEGSSPRVWGQEVIKVRGYVDSGIIPTRMGTSIL